MKARSTIYFIYKDNKVHSSLFLNSFHELIMILIFILSSVQSFNRVRLFVTP